MGDLPPLPLWQHLELGIKNFNTFNMQLKDRFPTEFNAINMHLSEMTHIFVSVVEKMEAETAMHGTKYAEIGRPTHLIPYLRPAPLRRDFGVIGGAVPASSSTFTSAPEGPRDETGELGCLATSKIPGRPQSVALGVRPPPGLDATSLPPSIIPTPSRAAESTAAIYSEHSIDYATFPNALPRSVIMAQRAQIALSYMIEQGAKGGQDVGSSAVEALRERKANLKVQEAVAQMEGGASCPYTARSYGESQLDPGAFEKQEAALNWRKAVQQMENHAESGVAQEDGQSQTETSSSMLQLQGSSEADTHFTMPQVAVAKPGVASLISDFKGTMPTSQQARACDNSVRMKSLPSSQLRGMESSNWRQYGRYNGSGEPSMAVKAPISCSETQSLQVEVPGSYPQVESKVETMAQKLSKLQEQVTSTAPAVIPRKSTVNSWAGIAVKGVEEKESKEINMRMKAQAPSSLPTRSFTTIGRLRYKNVDVDATNAQTETHTQLITKPEEASAENVRVGELEFHYCHNMPPDGPDTLQNCGKDLSEGGHQPKVILLSDIQKLVKEIPMPINPIRHEAAVDQQRVVYILNPPPTMTVAQVSDGIREGALVAIRSGIDSRNGERFFCIVFQFAPCLNNFLMVMEDERICSKPNRFGFIAYCVRDLRLYPYNELLRAMEEPIFARRRLTLAQKGLFFEWKKVEIERFLYSHVGQENIQFIHIYNGGNATICFSEVEAAIKMKSVLVNMVRTKAENNKFHDLNVSYSKDPCETELRLLTDGVF